MSTLARSLTAGACVLLTAGVALAARPTVHPNSLRYAERNPAAATGRAGSARVSLRALYSPSEETTDVELTTGSFDSAATAPGTIARLQLKLVDARGTAVWTSNQNRLAGGGVVSLGFGHLHPGERLQAQAQVQGVDGRRTDVVSVQGTVRRRPDLAVTRLELPPRVRRESVVNVQATVTEMNGDAGARADCVLLVDGAPVDRALGIWVDGGRSVSCAFSHRFATAGARNVQVLIENVAPRDDVLVNNDQEGTIVVFDEAPLGHSAFVWSRAVQHLSRQEGSYDDGTWSRRDWAYLSRTEGWEEGVSLQAWTAARVATSIAVAVWEGPPGTERRTYERSGWTPAAQWGDASCGGMQDYDHDAATAVWIYVLSAGCTGSGWTQVDYQRYAGDVVYFSSGYEVIWNHTDGSRHQYAWNTAARTTTGLRLVDAGAATHRLRLHLHDGTLRAADVQVPLQPFSNDSHDPYNCHQYDYGYSLRECSEQRHLESGATGSAASGE